MKALKDVTPNDLVLVPSKSDGPHHLIEAVRLLRRGLMARSLPRVYLCGRPIITKDLLPHLSAEIWEKYPCLPSEVIPEEGWCSECVSELKKRQED